MGESSTLSSVERALALLEVLAREESLNLTQLADRLHAGKTTVFRLAATLVERGWLSKSHDLRYRLGPAALSLGVGPGGPTDIKKLLLPIMIELHEETKETVHLTRLEGRYIVYLHQLLSPKPVVSLTTLETRSPAHCVSPGLAQLAALPDDRIDWVLSAPLVRYTDISPTEPHEVREQIARVREKGFGVNLGSFREDVGGVGVAVRNARGEPIAGLSLCIPVFRLALLDIDKLGERLLRAARDAETLLNAETEDQTGKQKDAR